MTNIVKCIENLHIQLERHRKDGLKEYPTRTIFVDPLLAALGWDVRDPDEVELEHPTVDSKSVDYAMKVNRKVALHLKRNSLAIPLTTSSPSHRWSVTLRMMGLNGAC